MGLVAVSLIVFAVFTVAVQKRRHSNSSAQTWYMLWEDRVRKSTLSSQSNRNLLASMNNGTSMTNLGALPPPPNRTALPSADPNLFLEAGGEDYDNFQSLTEAKKFKMGQRQMSDMYTRADAAR